MKRYSQEHPELCRHVETLLFGDKVVNVFLDDYGQTYILQYYENGEMVETSVGTYENDYVGCAEMLFEDPCNCNHYIECENNSNDKLFRCEYDDKTYCSNCKFCERVQDREERWLKKYGKRYQQNKFIQKENIMLSNKDCYKRNQAFEGNLIEWFNKCVDENDLFRVWWKGHEDDECDYYYIVNVIEIPGDYLLGLSSYDENKSKEDISITWYRLSEISAFSIVPNEK